MTTSTSGDRTVALQSDAPSDQESLFFGLRASAWFKILSLATLFVLLFWPNLRRLWGKTNPFDGEENWRHGIFVPLIGLYYLYINRERLLSAQTRTAWTGLAIAVAGIAFYVYAIWPGQNDWFKDIGMVIALFGIVALVCGWEVMKTAWFPIVFLICALPWPGLFYSKLAGPLQKLAATVAVKLLTLIGVGAGQWGTKLFVVDKFNVVHTLNVAEACSGLRSLMTFIAIAGAVAFLSFRPLWQKILMVCSAVPIAIFCNTLRVTVQGGFAKYGSADWAESFAHGFIGFVMMIPAFFLILLVGWVLQNIFIDEVDDKKAFARSSTVISRPRAGVGSTTGRKRVIARPVEPTSANPRRMRAEQIDANVPAVESEPASDETPVAQPIPRRLGPATSPTSSAATQIPRVATTPAAAAPASASPAASANSPAAPTAARPKPPAAGAIPARPATAPPRPAGIAATHASTPAVAKRPAPPASTGPAAPAAQKTGSPPPAARPAAAKPAAPAGGARPAGNSAPVPAKPASTRPNSASPTPTPRPTQEPNP